MQQKVGIGYDIHRLKKGRKLILGGIHIPHVKGLAGHSDADVLVHAICDALLGAVGAGDIGGHFPNTDKRYRGISSLLLLSKVNQLIRKEGFEVSNIDTVVLAEEPQLKPFKEKMRQAIAETLAITKNAVNIKATTQEGVGFGSAGNDAIAAYAVTLLAKKKRTRR